MTDESRSAPAGATVPAGSAVSGASVGETQVPSERPAVSVGEERPVLVTQRRRWALFAGLAAVVVLADQAAKAVVTRSLAAGQSVDVVGDLVRIVFGQNSGALFGMFKDNAWMFGVVSLAVVGLIVAYHARSAASLYLTVTLGLLLGGAIGNMLDRLYRGFVVDFVDVGIGQTRFYTFNVADSAISLAILLLFIAALRPSLVDGAFPTVIPPSPASEPSAASEPAAAAPADDDWDDGLEPDDRPRTDSGPR